MKKINYIIGDNPFFNVDHAGRRNFESNSHKENASVVCSAFESGVDTFMISPHESHLELLDEINQKSKIEKPKLAYVFPNTYQINSTLAQKGYRGLVSHYGLLSSVSLALNIAFQLILFKRVKYFKKLFRHLLRNDMKIVASHGHLISHYCLHNIITDLLLASDNRSMLNAFISACHKEDVIPVLISQNPETLLAYKCEKEFIPCISANATGYMVNPSLESFRNALSRTELEDIWLMQIFSSGSIAQDQAADFVRDVQKLNDKINLSLILASRTPGRIENTIKYFDAVLK